MPEPAYLRTTRAAYDAVAGDYAERFRTELEAKPLGRAMLAAFAELVRTTGAGPVADVGCGPGRVTAHLHSLGVDAFGIDLSPAMVAVARRAHPGLRFDVGTLTALDLPDGALAGVVAWYSIIHTPPEQLPEAFAELHRVLAPGGRLLVAFQVRDESVRVSEGFGRAVALDFHPLSPELVGELLERAGFVVDARLVREPDVTEKVPQAHLLARRPARCSRGWMRCLPTARRRAAPADPPSPGIGRVRSTWAGRGGRAWPTSRSRWRWWGPGSRG